MLKVLLLAFFGFASGVNGQRNQLTSTNPSSCGDISSLQVTNFGVM
jgi:hypothetical protein